MLNPEKHAREAQRLNDLVVEAITAFEAAKTYENALSLQLLRRMRGELFPALRAVT